MTRSDIRLGLPSKGILRDGAVEFLTNCGLKMFRPNPRQYAATIPNLPGVIVLFQRPGDIVVGVRQGSVDFGISGYDVVAEKGYGSDAIVILHDALGFGSCTLDLAVPEASPTHTMADLAAWAEAIEGNGRILRIATKFPHLTREMLDKHGVQPYKLIGAEGTLEIAPEIGFADVIADLVSSGITLRDNHLRRLDDGQIIASQAVLIGNKKALKSRPEILSVARRLLEFTEAYQRAQGSFTVTANIRGDSAKAIAQRIFAQTNLSGLQGPTISQVFPHESHQNGGGWYAINIVVPKETLFQAIDQLRNIGGSGVIVTPCAYIFEEEPVRYQAMLAALTDDVM